MNVIGLGTPVKVKMVPSVKSGTYRQTTTQLQFSANPDKPSFPIFLMTKQEEKENLLRWGALSPFFIHAFLFLIVYARMAQENIQN